MPPRKPRKKTTKKRNPKWGKRPKKPVTEDEIDAFVISLIPPGRLSEGGILGYHAAAYAAAVKHGEVIPEVTVRVTEAYFNDASEATYWDIVAEEFNGNGYKWSLVIKSNFLTSSDQETDE
ncbi:hypothetical protein M408DRAFT_23160 [Serendipita vermifera MAFF 305830]|uniref:Uncharacterized protein n=1 Tax=Serendipita vermifera MAFF 305830 TaxID=933852 RepID=A0A0C2XIM2_SERVB|nr:hypothetical protein M408DRAFT_23160 [Serendipita vermifera MAFF 305830]